MTFQLILFYIFAVIILYGAIKTVTAKNPVHAALHLVLTFCVSAMLWMLMQAEFLGVTLVVVYVGAVMVLFLFVVMMLNIDIEEMRAGFWRHAPVAGVVGTLLAVALILILVNPKTDLAAFGLMKDIPADYNNNIRDLGSRIYTDYLLPFELAAVLLLLGMVAAIALVHRKTTNPKRMDPADQVKVRADQGRMRLVKMEAVKPQVESAEESEVSDGLKPEGEGKA
ncbi:TPA: NADH-quinone oxidoreductase subunit J [Neisseria meningitidis]